jgi:flavin-dependent dehydrogenase
VKIAVIGGGTAGFIAAAHISHKLPEAGLLHIYDSRLPTIGVGEGTTPNFPVWFHEVTGRGFEELAARCRATLKKGTYFEGWGCRGADFLHRFQPARLIAYHFDAARVIPVLADHVRAERIDANVAALMSSADGVLLRLADGSTIPCDYVLDARGFPRPAAGTGAAAGPELVELNWIPTGRAMLRWLPAGPPAEHTRSIARPHGWIFQIPLNGSISCGYIYNPRISEDAEVEQDFTSFLAAEGIEGWEARGTISFPNFACRTWSDGRVFRLGNAGSFIEPLEATAIGTAIIQARAATRWIQAHGAAGNRDSGALASLNRSIFAYVCRNSLFLALHYACGSCWDTPFWQYASQGLERARRHDMAREHLPEMEEFLEAGARLPGRHIAGIDDQGRWDREVYPHLAIYRPFGNFSELNFAQVGHGIGYYGPVAAR